MFWDNGIETIDGKSLARLQLSKLASTLEKAAVTTFYKKLFKDHRIDIFRIKTLVSCQLSIVGYTVTGTGSLPFEHTFSAFSVQFLSRIPWFSI